jgi:hypothetical protein
MEIFFFSGVRTGWKVEAVFFRRSLSNNNNNNTNNNNNKYKSRMFLKNVWYPPTSLYGVIIPTSVKTSNSAMSRGVQHPVQDN